MTSANVESPSGTVRVVFLGTPEFAVPSLRALNENTGIAVALVVTQPDRPSGRGQRLLPSAVKQFALEQGLAVYQPERLRGAAVIERLRAADADLFVIAAYGQLLRQAVLDLPRHGCLNVHPSLLPRHRGPSPIAAAILAGDERTGVTIMLTERGMDTGPILTQESVPLGREETSATLTPRLAELGADLLLRTIPGWIAGTIVPQQQDERRATLSRMFAKADGAIDWARPASEIARQVHALNPWPRAFTQLQGKRFQILLAEASDQALAGPPGTIGSGAGKALLVATSVGTLRLDRVQLEGGREVAGSQFLGNYPAIIGTRLG